MPKRPLSELATPFDLPSVGLGLWKAQKAGEAKGAVIAALKAGYKLLDGAAAYGNEGEVGDGLHEAIAAGVVKREDVWVVSKLFNTHHVWQGDKSRPPAGMDKTLKDLRLDYLDLYLMHWPMAFQQTDLKAIGGLRLPCGTPNPKLVMQMEFVETWKCMLELRRAGKAKHLGVCNFTVDMLKELMAACPDDVPEVNQVEMHPYLAQPELVYFCQAHSIKVMAYSPLGSGDSYSGSSFPAVGIGPFQSVHGTA
jgi:alcohol dehydrogenase (NADP+)